MAKGTFATTVVMVYVSPITMKNITKVLTKASALFFFNLLLGIWSLIPTASQRAASKIDIDDMQTSMTPATSRFGKKNANTKDSPVSDSGNSDRVWEMKTVPKQPQHPPYTPRTLAFNTLDRQLPLRAQGEGRWS
jgi:hypothetical protein